MTTIEIEQWYHKWLSDRNKSGIVTENVLDMLKDFAHQQPVNDGWVRVEDALPKVGIYVLVIERYVLGDIEVGIARRSNYMGWNKPCKYITHWRPLPEPPKQ